jgi:hypothetical protein
MDQPAHLSHAAAALPWSHDQSELVASIIRGRTGPSGQLRDLPRVALPGELPLLAGSPGLPGVDSKTKRTNGTPGRIEPALCSIGPVAAEHTGHTDIFRLLGSRPEDAANHQERRAWDIWNLAVFFTGRGGVPASPAHRIRRGARIHWGAGEPLRLAWRERCPVAAATSRAGAGRSRAHRDLDHQTAR